MKLKITVVLIYFSFIYLFEHVNSKKILFISPSLSNSITMQTGRWADLLVQDGHNVVSLLKFGSCLGSVFRLSTLVAPSTAPSTGIL